jgi:PAS domain S-box-containing protein
MRIGTKLLLSFLIVAFLVLITGSLSYYFSNEIKNDLIRESGSTAVQLQTLTEMSVQLQNSLLYTRNYLTESAKRRAGDQSLTVSAQIRQSEQMALESLDRFEIELNDLSEKYMREAGIPARSDEQSSGIISLTDSLQRSFSYYETIVREIFELERETSFGDEIFNVTIEPYFRNTLLPILLQLRTAYNEQVDLQLATLQARAEETVLRIIFYSVLSFVMSLLLAFLVYRSITKPVKELTDTARQLGDGDLSQRIQLNTGDELANLADTFNKMAENLSKSMVSRSYVNNIIQSMGDMLFVTGADGSIELINQAVKDKLEYRTEDLKNDSFWFLISGEEREYVKEIVESGSGNGTPIETRLVTKFGTVIPVNLSYTVLSGNGKEMNRIFVASDISTLKEAEQKISDSLREKNVLLAEIHHRVKNNLAVISGLIEMQVWSIEEEESKTILRDSQLRIQSIALVHEKLYQTDNFAEIKISEYIRELVEGISESFSNPNAEIKKSFACEDIKMNINQAIPFSLLLNETVVNAFKHGFKGRKKGELKIHLSQKGEDITLMVSDDGVGLPSPDAAANSKSLGMKLIETLTSQLEGEFELKDNPDSAGVSFKIVFPTDTSETTFANHVQG